MPRPIPITVLCGFLGSGKTTLLRQWRTVPALQDAAVIVQDLSELGVDAELVGDHHQAPAAGTMTGRLAALHGRHAREELHSSMGRTLEAIAELSPRPGLVLVESTGVARPWPLIVALTQSSQFQLRHFLVTVDALSLHRDYENGAALNPGADAEPIDHALEVASAVLREQIRFANAVILTKIDRVPESSWRTALKCIQAINPTCTIALSAHAGLRYEQLERTSPPRLENLRTLAAELNLSADSTQATVDPIDAVVLRDRRPFHPRRLYEACQRHLGTGLYRTKGFLWLASRPGDVLLWQQSGSQIALELMGWWRAELVLNRDGKLLPEEVDFLRERLRTADPLFGDRHNELTLIGLQAPRDGFAQVLQGCLCTDEEIRAWQAGERFEDPWPTTMRQHGRL